MVRLGDRLVRRAPKAPGEVRRITVLGSTGSIGTQTLEVVRENPGKFRVMALTCGRNRQRLEEQISEFHPEFVSCASKEDADQVAAGHPGLKVGYGESGLIDAAEWPADIVLNSLMGMRGLVPTVHAVRAGRDIALANKETLVAGGAVVMDLIRERGVNLLPVDSEHSAIFQSLEGNRDQKIRRILLTASGGPFRGWSREQMKDVTPAMALNHPNWSMGKKITIDSATMMNKGLEMIEAKWLFGVDIRDIQVLVHPQSIVHSAVEFQDTAVIAQLGVPDMKIPIMLALSYPERLPAVSEPLDFFSGKAAGLTFEPADTDAFPCLRVAREASLAGGCHPVIMNAANEVLVQAFLNGRIGFLDIPDRIAEELAAVEPGEEPDLEDILRIDAETRKRTEAACGL